MARRPLFGLPHFFAIEVTEKLGICGGETDVTSKTWVEQTYNKEQYKTIIFSENWKSLYIKRNFALKH